MGGLILLYYAVCYSAGGASLIVSLIAAKSRSNAHDARFAAVSLSLALMLVPFSIRSYLGARRELMALTLVLWLVTALGEALMIALLPRFVHSLLPSRRQRVIDATWTAAAAIAFCCQPLAMLFPNTIFLVFVPMAIMPAAIVYIAIVVFVRGFKGRGWKASIEEAELARWKSMMKASTILSAVFLPFMIAIDFFPGLLIGSGLSFPALSQDIPPLLRGLEPRVPRDYRAPPP